MVELYKGFHTVHAVSGDDGRRYEVVERGDAVSIVPYDPNRDTVVMVRQYRAGVSFREGKPRHLLEFPAGMIDKGELPADTALRELEEETGLKASEMALESLYYSSPGGSAERIFQCLAIVDSSLALKSGGKASEGEKTEVVLVDRGMLPRFVECGEIMDAAGLIGIAMLVDYVRQLSPQSRQ